jgi:hypothetical protein
MEKSTIYQRVVDIYDHTIGYSTLDKSSPISQIQVVTSLRLTQ